MSLFRYSSDFLVYGASSFLRGGGGGGLTSAIGEGAIAPSSHPLEPPLGIGAACRSQILVILFFLSLLFQYITIYLYRPPK